MNTPLSGNGIPVLDRVTSISDVVDALDAAGCAVIERAVDLEVLERILAELEPHRARNSANPHDDWAGAHTVRTGGVLHRAPASHALALHPLVLGAAGAVLRRHCRNVQLNNCLVMDVQPGEKAQDIHRDELAWWPLVFPPGMEVIVNAMWALSDFEADNGATLVHPGSHVWDADRRPEIGTALKATMRRGSVFLFTGKCWHGAGANVSRRGRVGLSIAYMNSLLRQSENQYLTNPPEFARHYPPQLARLVGYARGGDAIGHFRDIEHPRAVLEPENAVAFARGYRFVDELDAV